MLLPNTTDEAYEYPWWSSLQLVLNLRPLLWGRLTSQLMRGSTSLVSFPEKGESCVRRDVSDGSVGKSGMSGASATNITLSLESSSTPAHERISRADFLLKRVSCFFHGALTCCWALNASLPKRACATKSKQLDFERSSLACSTSGRSEESRLTANIAFASYGEYASRIWWPISKHWRNRPSFHSASAEPRVSQRLRETSPS